MTQRLIVGISGASGVIYGIRMLEALAQDKTIPFNPYPPYDVLPSVGIDVQSQTGAAVTATSSQRVVTALSTVCALAPV